MIDLAKEIWQTMCTNKLRTFLTGLSVAWGIFMLILLLAISKGVINSVQREAGSNDPMRISVWGGLTSRPFQGMKEGRQIPLKDSYLPGIAERNKGHVTSADGIITYNARVSTIKDYLNTASCQGVFPSAITGRYRIVSGRAINDNDLKHKRKVIMLHTGDVATLFDDTVNVVGRMVKVGDLNFTVVGIYDHNWSNEAFIPYTTAIALNSFNENLDRIDVHIKDVGSESESGSVEKSVIGTLASMARFDPDDPSAVYTYDRFAASIQQEQGLGILNAAMWVIGILTLITGIVGVSNIMFVSVRERTHEIGIRRAIGAKPRSILMQIVLESVVLTTAFGYVGIVLGTFATEAVKMAFAGSDFMLNPEVDLGIALDVTIALIIAGALAGVFPALKATKVKPVEALRDE